MTTYSKKYFNEETQQWEPLYSTEGRSAYETAKLNGYTGTEEEFNNVLSKIPVIISSIESYPTEGSKNLITSGGVYQALKDSETSAEETHQELLNEISNVNSTLSTEISTVNTNLTTKITQIETTTIPNAIKAAIVDNLDTEDSNKALSATQGKVLKTMISNLANLRIEVVNELPSTGETNVIYLVKKAGANPDVHDEYVYVEGNWEKIGNTEVDLSNYYTKDQVYTKSETYSQEEVGTLITEIEGKIPTIPNVETSMSGAGNVITSIDVDASNKHKIAAVKGISVYSKSEINEKLSGSGLGDVIAEAPFTTADRVITSGGAGKTVKDSGILLTNLATKEFVNQFEPEWDKIANKPSTFTPSAHTHTVSQITDFPTLVVDSALSAASENPVQNKVITNALSSYVKTADLNVTLGNYYTTSEVYTRQEVNDKIASAGGGDVMANGNLEEDCIIVGAGTKSIKNSSQTLSNLALKSDLSGYATQSWVTGQGYSTENTWRPVKVGSTTLNDSSTTLTIANGTGIGLSFSNGTLTITNSAPGSSYTLPVAKDNVLGGIKTGYTESGGAEMAIYTLEDGTAYTFLRSAAIKTALGFTPADVNDIPEIPTALPNPYSLNIIAGGSTTSYTGSSASTINLDSIFSKPLASVDTPGKAGIFYGSSSSYSVSTVYVTSSNPDAVIVVPTATTVTFGSNYVKMSGLDDLTGGSYKCYCITYINTGLVLVNGAIYG